MDTINLNIREIERLDIDIFSIAETHLKSDMQDMEFSSHIFVHSTQYPISRQVVGCLISRNMLKIIFVKGFRETYSIDAELWVQKDCSFAILFPDSSYADELFKEFCDTVQNEIKCLVQGTQCIIIFAL